MSKNDRTIDKWLNEYAESHQNPKNKLIHWIFIPLIMFSLVGLLFAIPVPGFLDLPAWVNFGTLAIALALLFYVRLSFPMFLGFLLTGILIIWGNLFLSGFGAVNHFLISVVLFVISWVAQFIGHHIEGKKPSFFKDLQFLLIGPAWLLHFIFKKLQIPY